MPFYPSLQIAKPTSSKEGKQGSYTDPDVQQRPSRAMFILFVLTLLRCVGCVLHVPPSLAAEGALSIDLRACDAAALRRLLAIRSLLPGVLNHLSSDPLGIIGDVLETLGSCVLDSGDISPAQKSQALQEQALLQLAKVAADAQWRADADPTSSEPKDDDEPDVPRRCLSLLLRALQDPALGLCPISEPAWAASLPAPQTGSLITAFTLGDRASSGLAASTSSAAPPTLAVRLAPGAAQPLLEDPALSRIYHDADFPSLHGARRVLRVLQRLKPVEHRCHAEAVAAALRGRPALAQAYLQDLPFAAELAKQGPDYLVACSVAAAAIRASNPPPGSDADSGLDIDLSRLEVRVDLRALQRRFLPAPLSRAAFSRGLLSKDPLARYATSALLLAVLQAAANSLDGMMLALRRRRSTLLATAAAAANGDSASAACAALAAGEQQAAASFAGSLRPRLPDVQDLLKVSSLLLDALEAASNAPSDASKARGGAQALLEIEVVANCLAEYSRLMPQVNHPCPQCTDPCIFYLRIWYGVCGRGVIHPAVAFHVSGLWRGAGRPGQAPADKRGRDGHAVATRVCSARSPRPAARQGRRRARESERFSWPGPWGASVSDRTGV